MGPRSTTQSAATAAAAAEPPPFHVEHSFPRGRSPRVRTCVSACPRQNPAQLPATTADETGTSASRPPRRTPEREDASDARRRTAPSPSAAARSATLRAVAPGSRASRGREVESVHGLFGTGVDAAHLRLIEDGASAIGLRLAPDQVALLARHVDLLLRWNKSINLTSITDPAEVVEQHVLDSLALVPLVPA